MNLKKVVKLPFERDQRPILIFISPSSHETLFIYCIVQLTTFTYSKSDDDDLHMTMMMIHLEIRNNEEE
jgi:hypothetical protein